MKKPEATRCARTRHASAFKHLCVRLTEADERAISQGLAAAKALGLATIRTRAAFIRDAFHAAAHRHIEAARRVAELY